MTMPDTHAEDYMVDVTTESSEIQVCKKCRTKLLPGSKFCHICGTAQEQKPRRSRTRGNGQGSVYRRGKSWEVAVVIGYKLVDGKSQCVRRKKGGFRTKKEALEYIPQLRTESHRTTPTVQFLWEAFQAGQYKKLSKSKQDAYRIAYNKLESIHLTRIDLLTTYDLQSVIDQNASTFYPARDMKNLLSKLYQSAMADQYVTVNLSDFVILPELNAKEQQAFNEDEIRKLWESYTSGNIWTGYILLMAYTGMMPGELLALKKENIDWKNKIIIRSGLKTKKRKETPIVMADIIIPVLLTLCASNNSEKVLPINKDRFYQVYYETVSSAGVRKLPPYSCRHTTATALAMANIPPSVIQQIMRHAKFTTTQNYIHIDMAAALEAVNLLSGSGQ